MKLAYIQWVARFFLIPHMKTEVNVLKLFSLMIIDCRKDYIFFKEQTSSKVEVVKTHRWDIHYRTAKVNLKN